MNIDFTNSRLKKNNFDLLRLLFASTVCLVHAYTLSGFYELGWIGKVLSSDIAVKAFFVVSGFLIFMSFERSKSINLYAKKRIRRIYPAYFTVVIICAIGLIIISSKNIAGYFSYAWVKYVVANLSFLNFLQLTLPGVFDSNRLPFVNGALWTLKIEVMFYCSVPIFVFLFRKFNCFAILALTYCLSVGYSVLLSIVAHKSGMDIFSVLARQLPGQLSYFVSGGFYFYYLQLFERHIGYFVVPSFLILVIDKYYALSILEPFALATVVIFFGLFLYMGNFGKYGDFSYGIYIIHFPVIQVIINSGWVHSSPWLFLGSVIIFTLIGAILLWHLIEKRYLLRKSHYIKATSAIADIAPQPGHALPS